MLVSPAPPSTAPASSIPKSLASSVATSPAPSAAVTPKVGRTPETKKPSLPSQTDSKVSGSKQTSAEKTKERRLFFRRPLFVGISSLILSLAQIFCSSLSIGFTRDLRVLPIVSLIFAGLSAIFSIVLLIVWKRVKHRIPIIVFSTLLAICSLISIVINIVAAALIRKLIPLIFLPISTVLAFIVLLLQLIACLFITKKKSITTTSISEVKTSEGNKSTMDTVNCSSSIVGKTDKEASKIEKPTVEEEMVVPVEVSLKMDSGYEDIGPNTPGAPMDTTHTTYDEADDLTKKTSREKRNEKKGGSGEKDKEKKTKEKRNSKEKEGEKGKNSKEQTKDVTEDENKKKEKDKKEKEKKEKVKEKGKEAKEQKKEKKNEGDTTVDHGGRTFETQQTSGPV